MLKIPFDFDIVYSDLKRKISDEWSIEIVCDGSPSMITGIKIHRKNATETVLVSGEIVVLVRRMQISNKKFSQYIKNGFTFEKIYFNERSLCWGSISFRGFIEISDLSEKQLDNMNISLINQDHTGNSEKEESKLKMQLKSLQELSHDLERLLQPDSSDLADVTLKCNGVSIPAHKNILSARSPVFARMFASPMKESIKNEVDITDIDESVLRDLLKYMYTGRISDLSVSTAADLLCAAEKYQLEDLKAVCSFSLKDAVSPENVWMILVLGDMYSADLKSFAVDYICNKCGKFSVLENTKEWKELRKEKPGLALELLELLLKYREEK